MKERDPSTDFKLFRLLANDNLRFLASNYGFAEAEAHLLFPGMWVSFRNSTTQVCVQFEYESGLWVTIGRVMTFRDRIVGGEQYNLNELLALRAPLLTHTVRMNEFDESSVGEVLAERAEALKQYADDILRGDFEVFGKLEDIVAARTAHLYPETS